MKNGHYFSGTLLLALGLFWLGAKFDILNFNLEFIFNLWPLFFVFWGLLVMLKKNIIKPVISSLFGLFVAMFIVGSLQNINGGFNFVYDEDFSDNKNFNSYKTNMDSSATYGVVEIETGAATIKIADTTNLLVEAKTKGVFSDYNFYTNIIDSTAKVSFTREGPNDIKIKGKIKNLLEVKLNPRLIWDFDISCGAAKTELDLSNYKTRNIEINTGAATHYIKIGELYERTAIDVEMGATTLNVKIPKNSGCKIDGDLVLSTKNFNGFSKVGGNYYVTDNFDSAKNKIFIQVNGGISTFNVERY